MRSLLMHFRTLILISCCWAVTPASFAAEARDASWQFIQRALVASGVTQTGLLHERQLQWTAGVARLPPVLRRPGPHTDRAGALLAWMHAELLYGGYHAGASSLDETFASGRFNCLTSAVLYCALAQEIGLPVRGIAASDHVYVEIVEPQGFRPIETTTADATAKPKAKHPAPRVLSARQLVALIYYNRGVACFARKQYAQAAELSARALQLDFKNAAAHENLMAAVNNWAIALSEERRFDEAQSLLRFGHAAAPEDASLRRNLQAVERALQDKERP